MHDVCAVSDDYYLDIVDFVIIILIKSVQY
jgi:hypothetical protein